MVAARLKNFLSVKNLVNLVIDDQFAKVLSTYFLDFICINTQSTHVFSTKHIVENMPRKVDRMQLYLMLTKVVLLLLLLFALLLGAHP